MIDLTEEQRRRLEQGEAVEVSELQTSRPCVLLRRDVYERVRHLLYDDTEWTDDELRQQLARSAAANGWDELRASRHPVPAPVPGQQHVLRG
jgi:hypothetical protein